MADKVLHFLDQDWRRLFANVVRQLVGGWVSVGDLNPQGSDVQSREVHFASVSVSSLLSLLASGV